MLTYGLLICSLQAHHSFLQIQSNFRPVLVYESYNTGHFLSKELIATLPLHELGNGFRQNQTRLALVFQAPRDVFKSFKI